MNSMHLSTKLQEISLLKKHKQKKEKVPRNYQNKKLVFKISKLKYNIMMLSHE